MARCEDFPCCGHEAGCCPNYNASGRQTDMVCVCGARLPVDNRYSCCDSCLNDPEDYDRDEEADRDFLLEQQELEDFEQADEYFHDNYNDWE